MKDDKMWTNRQESGPAAMTISSGLRKIASLNPQGGAHGVRLGVWRLLIVALAATCIAMAPCEAPAQPTLFDGEGWEWDFNDDGSVSDGTDDAYDDAMELYVDGSDFPELTTYTLTMSGREVVWGPTTMTQLLVTRRTYVPDDDNWCRFLEILENPTSASVMVTVRIEGDLGSDEDTVVTDSSSGDSAFTTADRWFCTDDDTDGADDPTLIRRQSRQRRLSELLEISWRLIVGVCDCIEQAVLASHHQMIAIIDSQDAGELSLLIIVVHCHCDCERVVGQGVDNRQVVQGFRDLSEGG